MKRTLARAGVRLALGPGLLASAGCGSELPTAVDRPPIAAPFLVKDIAPGSASSMKAAQGRISAAPDGLLFFTADDGAHGAQLWRSNGTGSGTWLVAEAENCPNDHRRWLGKLVWVQSRLYFTADDGIHGRELWTSDGTAPGTRLFKDVVRGSASAANGLSHFTNVDGSLYFVGTESRDGRWNNFTLFRSDTTPDGTGVVRMLGTRYSGGSNPTWMSDPVAVGGLLYFHWDHEVWRSDGSAEGTFPVFDRGSHYGGGIRLVERQGRLFFSTDGYDNELRGLWTTDGTVAGTELLRDMASFQGLRAISGLLAAGSTLFFSTTGGQLWKSDGTVTGTTLVKTWGQEVRLVNAVGGSAYFLAGSDLWTSDGREEGTRLVFGGLQPRSADASAVAGTRLYFVADDGVNGRELWTSNGTAEGTRMVTDIRPGPLSSSPSSLIVSGSWLFFSADDGSTGRELWALRLGPR